jgi:hypothetical protein
VFAEKARDLNTPRPPFHCHAGMTRIVSFR